MNEEILFSAFDLGLLIAFGAAILASLLGARWLIRLLPMSKQARSTIGRLAPVVSLAVALAYLAFVVRVLFREEGALVSALLGLLLVALVAVSWGSIKDFVSGVVVKVGQVIRVGDHVRIGDTHGRVVKLGQRAAVIEATDGSEAVLPYTAVSKGLVRRSPAIEGASIHVFELPIRLDIKLPDQKRMIREAALRSHWSSVTQDPKVEPAEDHKLEITVFPLHPDYAPDIENSIRQALAPTTPPIKQAMPPTLAPPKVTPPPRP